MNKNIQINVQQDWFQLISMALWSMYCVSASAPRETLTRQVQGFHFHHQMIKVRLEMLLNVCMQWVSFLPTWMLSFQWHFMFLNFANLFALIGSHFQMKRQETRDNYWKKLTSRSSQCGFLCKLDEIKMTWGANSLWTGDPWGTFILVILTVNGFTLNIPGGDEISLINTMEENDLICAISLVWLIY